MWNTKYAHRIARTTSAIRQEDQHGGLAREAVEPVEAADHAGGDPVGEQGHDARGTGSIRSRRIIAAWA